MGGEKKEEKVMEGVASLALLPSGSISGLFIQLPNSICYGLHGIGIGFFVLVKELECERECSRGEDYRLIKLTVTDFDVSAIFKKERTLVVECRGHDAAKICTPDHAHGWQKDVVGMVEEKHAKHKITVHFECETLKSDEAAEDHLRKFMPKFVGMDAVVNIGRMTIAGLNFEADAEYERSENKAVHPNVAVCAETEL
ncbi:hypothetical protein SASPL_142402 [Salvia splendens]|uniref:Uncharacterized protein n=1 Tax=Salvia splendens TaxID=180675 RepID=A0A8X8WLU1_SALSN|nr:hypothetical protein SASPL_142402 [Salvia splendens]